MALRERLINVDERRNVAWKEASDLVELAAGEGRGLSAEEQVRYDGLIGEVDTLGEERERILAHEARSEKLATPQREIRLLPGGDRVATPPAGGEREIDKEEYHGAFLRYMRAESKSDVSREDRQILQRGRVMYDAEGRALTTQTGSSGGYTIPQGFEDMLTVARKQFGGMRQARTNTFATETGNLLPIPAMNDTGNKGVLLAENTQMANQDLAFTTRNLAAYVMHSKAVLVPWQLLQDSAFDIEALLAAAFGERIGRIENDYFTTGTGTSQPLGVVAAGTVALTGGSAAASGPTYAELVTLFHSVDPAYRAFAQWMMNDTTIGLIRDIVDGNGRPLWLPAATGGLADDVPDRIMGREVVTNQSMADAATVSDYPIAFGDFSAYWIRDVRGIQMVRLDERYADYLQSGFFAYARTDGTLVDAGTHPIKLFRSHAS